MPTKEQEERIIYSTITGIKTCAINGNIYCVPIPFVAQLVKRPPGFVGGESSGTPLQDSCLESSRDRGAWWAAVHGAAKSRTRLSDFTFTFRFHALEKEMATHSSVLA
ncbi:unnamed protein product [Rangifer tarandus platyrhynchus]|uniref:Uncharacterized protein n=1 Tax=Rangifer tarandus platyrhynchus TaxID=3082113 RepID=A0AC59Z8T8_RANTA